MLVEATFNRITHEIIGAAIEVHRNLGPGLLESAYMPCLQYELAARKLRFVTERSIPNAKLIDGVTRLIETSR